MMKNQKIKSKYTLSFVLVALLATQYFFSKSSNQMTREALAQATTSGELDLASESLESIAPSDSMDPIQKEKAKLQQYFAKMLMPSIETTKGQIESLKEKAKDSLLNDLDSILKKIEQSQQRLSSSINGLEALNIHMSQVQKENQIKSAKTIYGEAAVSIMEARLALIDFVAKNKDVYSQEADQFESMRSEVLAVLNDARVTYETEKAE